MRPQANQKFPADKLNGIKPNMSMHFHLKRTVVRNESVYDEALREFGQHDDLPPVRIDVERFDRALASLASGRVLVPSELSVEGIVEFMNHVATDK